MKRILIAAAALMLAACSTPQSTQYFVLPDSRYTRPQTQGAELAVEVILAEPLAGSGLVYQTDALHINMAKNHLWAADLENALAANISNKLNRLNPRHTFVPVARSSSETRLRVYIEAFHGSYQGHTLVSGYALWQDGTARPFAVETPQEGDGYAAMVESLARGLEQAAVLMNR